jgi:SOS-response transcriptional repressor LexA
MTKRQKPTNDRRRDDLQRFITERKIKVARWAREAGLSEGTIRNFLTKRSATLTQATADALAAAMGIPTSTIFPSVENVPAKGKAVPNLSFIASNQGGLGAKDLPIIQTSTSAGRMRLDHSRTPRLTERPEYLRRVRTAYALRIQDTSMSPAFEPEWLIYVDPTDTAKPGDNVVATLDGGGTVIRRLVRKSKAGVTLRQFNPKKDVQVKAPALVSLHCIAGVRYRK